MLYGALDNHPDVCMAKPVRPEPKYFLKQNYSYQDYLETLFTEPNDCKWLGEKSTSYYEVEGVAERIKNTIPEVKLLFMMRNPIDRALSNYRFSRDNGLETRTLRQVFIEGAKPPVFDFKTSVDPFTYLERGIYHTFLARYYQSFSPSQILPIVFESFIAEKDLNSIWNFLELDHLRIKRNDQFQNKSIPIEEDEEVRETLTKYFEPHNLKLEELLDIDLSCWR